MNTQIKQLLEGPGIIFLGITTTKTTQVLREAVRQSQNEALISFIKTVKGREFTNMLAYCVLVESPEMRRLRKDRQQQNLLVVEFASKDEAFAFMEHKEKLQKIAEKEFDLPLKVTNPHMDNKVFFNF